MTQFATSITDYLSANPNLAILILFLVAFGEAMLFIGLFVPSTPVMIGAGALVGLGKLSLWPVLIAAAVGAIAGDAVSFWIGRRGKDRLIRVWPLASHPDLLVKGERFFARHGAISIFLARFVPVVKAVLPTVAGMSGMSPARFAVVNVLSAFVWSAAHLFPSMLVGRGLGVAATANPKVIELVAIVLVLGGLTWLVARLLFRKVVPWLAGVTRGVLDRWSVSQRSWLRQIGLRLTSATGASGLLVEALLAIAAVAALCILAVLIVLDPGLSRADAAIAGWVGGLQSDLATRIFLGLTMLADAQVLLPVAGTLLFGLALLREWRLTAVLATGFAATLAFVPVVKLLVHRARPTQIYSGADAFSFPSGHATHATVILGAAALILSASLPRRLRGLLYASVAVVILLVALSRVYLGAHWPTDVVAGILFGAIVLIAVAVLTRDRRSALSRPGLSAFVAVVFSGIFALHLSRDYTPALAFYAPGRVIQTVSATDWTAGTAKVPSDRTLLDGDPGEPMILQTDLPLADVVAGLEKRGWKTAEHSWLAEVADAALPTRSAINGLAPWPLTHLGRRPLATLTLQDSASPDRRRVLRIWDSGIRITGSSGQIVLLLSATTEFLEPLAVGFAMLDTDPHPSLDPASLQPDGTRLISLASKPPILTAK